MASETAFPVYPGWNTVRKIGSGSYGAVYEIERDLSGTKEKRALKVISIPRNESEVEELYSYDLDEDGVRAYFESLLADIVREYRFLAELKGHPNITECYDIRQIPHEGFGWDVQISMELLTPMIKAFGPVISEDEVLKLGKSICSALVTCRSRNILHRDIKPQNIFISEDGAYKLGDFGIAKTVEHTSGGTKAGTFDYMAPEIFRNDPYGQAADLYSLGLVMYWMLNDRRMPFYPLPPAIPSSRDIEKARKRRFGGEKLPLPAHGSRPLQEIVLKACAFNPKDRFCSAKEMLSELEKLRDPFGSVSIFCNGQEFAGSILHDGQKIIIGREPDCNICIPGEFRRISRHHCIVSYDAAARQFLLTNCSTNGVFTLDGELIERNSPIRIESGLFALADKDCLLTLEQEGTA